MEVKNTASGPSPGAGLREVDRTLIGGAFFLTIANIVSQGINYAIHIGIGRFFDPSLYGYFGILASTFVLLEVILRWGLPQAVSFHIARDKDTAREVLKKTLALQALLAVTLFVLFFSFADRLALLLGDPELSAYLRPSAFFILAFAFVPVFTGFLNGIGAFGKQGAINVIRSLVRLVLILALLAYGMGIYGIIIAYTLSPLAAVAYGIWMAGSSPSATTKKKVETGDIIALSLPLFGTTLAMSFLMRIDLFMVQSFLGDRVLTGLYNAASTLIRGPYFLSLGAGLVMFRIVAQLKAKGPSETRAFISRSIRYYLLGLAPLPFIILGSAEGILRMVFGESYLPAAPTLMILSFSLVFMVLYHVFTTCISALGHPRWSMALGVFLLPIQGFFIYEWIFSYRLVGVALATTASWALGSLVGALCLVRQGYLELPKWKTLLNLAVACLASYYIASWISPESLWLLLSYPLAYLIYFTILRLTGEIGKGEISAFFAAVFPARGQTQRA